MFVIENVSTENRKTLMHSENVFHEALDGGEERYHVKDEKNGDYDLVYFENESFNPYLPGYSDNKRIPDYLSYDENQTESLVLDMYRPYCALSCEEVNEYTVVIAKVLIKLLDYDVYFTDKTALRFIDSEKLHIVEKLPEDKNVFYIQKQWNTGLRDGIFNHLSAPYAFHNMFLFQYILEGKDIKNIKYLSFQMSEVGGIGAVLEYANRFSAAFGKIGIKVIFTDDKVGRFKREMISKYFNTGSLAEDANENNTIYMKGLMTTHLITSHFIQSQKSDMDTSILAEDFRRNMDEYFDAVFGGKRVLGVLIRGSDYITTGLSGSRKQATADEMIPEINRWLEEDGYDIIFLATEDSDVLNRMKAEYGNRVKAISQERFSVGDFKDILFIYEYEKNNAKGEEYDNSVEDTTINYFYALYLLSKCESFMCSGQCNGYSTVLAFNGGRFKREYKFSVGVAQQ